MKTLLINSILRASLLIAALMTAAAATAYDFEIDGIQYTITSDSTVTVTGNYYYIYYDEILEIEIPSHVTYSNVNYIVNSIGDQAFFSYEACEPGITADISIGTCYNITIPETITSIGYEAFGGYCSLVNLICLGETPPDINNSFQSCVNVFVSEQAYPKYVDYNNQFHYFSSIYITNGEKSSSPQYSIKYLDYPDDLSEVCYYYGLYFYPGTYGCEIYFMTDNCNVYARSYDWRGGGEKSHISNSKNYYSDFGITNSIYFENTPALSGHTFFSQAFAIEQGKSPSSGVVISGYFDPKIDINFNFKDSGIAYNIKNGNELEVTYSSYHWWESGQKTQINNSEQINGVSNKLVSKDDNKSNSFYYNNCRFYFFYSGDVVIPSSVSLFDRYYNNYTTYLVTSIGSGAFSLNGVDYYSDSDPNLSIDCLTSVTLPVSINLINEYAFGDCPNLRFIKCNGSVPPSAYDDSFDDKVYQNTTLYVPRDAVEAYRYATGWKNFKNIVGHYDFDYDFELDGVYYAIVDNNAVVTDGEEPYKGVVNIPSTVTCDGVTYDVVGIGDSTFADATLQSLILPVTIGTIGESAFNGCHIGSIVITGNGAWNAGAINCEIDGLFVMSGVTGIQGLQMSPTTVYSYSTVPPTCDSGSFTGYDTALHVPASALAAYFTAPYWSNFINITSDAIEPTGLSINKDSIELLIGNQLSLTATPTPTTATPANAIIWTSTNDSIATVVNGAITAARVGECDIKAVLLDKIATCHVTVTEIPPTSVTINPEFAKLESGTQLTLTATVLPEDATDKVVTWESTNSAVATVSSEGIVTAVAPGECFITATCRDNQATCHIIVVDHFIYVSLDEHNVRLLPNHMITLTPSVIPEGTNLVVTSSNPTVAAARMANGIIQVVGITEGKTVISVNSTDGYAEADSCVVTVYTERGDVNCDGFINISDVTSLVNRLLTGQSANISEVNADANNDGQLSIADVTRLINHLLSGNELDPKEEPGNDGLSITSSVPMVALSPWERHPSKALSAPGIE